MNPAFRKKTWSRENKTEWLCQVHTPTPKRELVDGKWKQTGWRWSVIFSFYGASEAEAERKAEAFIEGELARHAKSESAKHARIKARKLQSLKAREAKANALDEN